MSPESNLMLDVGLANEIKLAARRAGATGADLKWLAEGENLESILPVARGLSEVVVKQHLINCDVEPYVPDDWKVEKHIKGGELRWNPDEVELWLYDKQKEGSIEGNQLRKLLKGKPVLNACVLDYLLANPHLIPEEWKGKAIFFWGTIYRSSDGDLFVRCLRWLDGRWCWGLDWLGFDFDGDDSAVLARK